MSPKQPKQPPGEAEGWESLAEEESAGSLAASPELEEALREAAEAVEARGKPEARPGKGAPAGAQGASDDILSHRDEATAERVEGLSADLIEAQDRLLRLQADFENFRKRALREREEALLYGTQNLVKDLLSTVDNLDRAIDHVRQSEGQDFDGLLQGVELVRRELLGALAKHGVAEVEAERQAFDPAVHEAMAQAPDASVAPNTVVDVLQKGYRLRERLLRPARVVVAKAPDGNGEGEAD